MHRSTQGGVYGWSRPRPRPAECSCRRGGKRSTTRVVRRHAPFCGPSGRPCQNGFVRGYAKERAHERIRAASRAGLDVAGFLDEASSALASAVPNENHLNGPYWYALDPQSRLITSDYGGEGCELDTATVMRWEYLEDDVNKYFDVLSHPRGVQTLHEVTAGSPERSRIYREYAEDQDRELVDACDTRRRPPPWARRGHESGRSRRRGGGCGMRKPAVAGPPWSAPDRIRTCDLRFRRPRRNRREFGIDRIDAVPVDLGEHRDQREALVAVDEGLALGDAVGKRSRLQRKVGVLVVRICARPSQRAFEPAAVT